MKTVQFRMPDLMRGCVLVAARKFNARADTVLEDVIRNGMGILIANMASADDTLRNTCGMVWHTRLRFFLDRDSEEVVMTCHHGQGLTKEAISAEIKDMSSEIKQHESEPYTAEFSDELCRWLESLSDAQDVPIDFIVYKYVCVSMIGGLVSLEPGAGPRERAAVSALRKLSIGFDHGLAVLEPDGCRYDYSRAYSGRF